MVAAYIGYKVGGIPGAVVATVFLPSFLIMLFSLLLLDRIRTLVWTRVAMRAVGPAVIFVMAVSLIQLGPTALPDAFARVVFVVAVFALLVWRIGLLKLMGLGAGLAVVRKSLAL